MRAIRRVRCSQLHGPGTVLLGDAAHAVTPIGGQGCNSALEDCKVLGQVLEQTGEDLYDLGSYILYILRSGIQKRVSDLGPHASTKCIGKYIMECLCWHLRLLGSISGYTQERMLFFARLIYFVHYTYLVCLQIMIIVSIYNIYCYMMLCYRSYTQSKP